MSVRPGVFRRKFHFADVLAAFFHHRADGFEALLARHVELHLEVQVRRRQENVHPRFCRGLERFRRGSNVFFARARQCRDRHGAHFFRHRSHRFEVAARRNRESCFDDVHVEHGKLLRHADFLRRVHREPRRLLAIAERCVKDAYDVHGCSPSLSNAERGPS